MMKTRLEVYPAIFTKCTDDGEYYVIEFIDLEGCITQGSDLQEAFFMAQDAMGLWLDDKIDFPNPTTDFSHIILEDNQFISFVNIDMDDYRKKFNNKAVKKTLTIPNWLNTLSEKNNVNFSQILQDALKKELNIDY